MPSGKITTKRAIIAIIAAAGCGWCFWQSARSGRARTLGESALATARMNEADEAVRLSPSDAEVHAVRGIVLQQSENYPEAQLEVERAVQLRPHDFTLWLLLGIIRDENQDQEGALLAFQRSRALAPAYSQPHWQLGNLLLRMDQPDEAFSELRKAATSDPELLPNVIDLAWGIYHGDINTVLAVVPPQTDAAHVELALFFARHQQAVIAAEQFLLAKTAPDRKAEALLTELLTARAYGDAYRVWARMHGLTATDAIGSIRDAGFESPITVGEAGFGWQIASDVTNIAMSVDEATHQSRNRSLRIDFHGNSNPQSPLLTQIILVKPLTHYHFSLAALTKDFVSAAEPVITLTDASDSKGTVLAQSAPLRSDANAWRDFTIDFTTNPNTQAITIALTRQACTSNPCPAIGTLWLDSVSIEAR
jgi:tetratricopeptide (TPR) repeat protein